MVFYIRDIVYFYFNSLYGTEGKCQQEPKIHSGAAPKLAQASPFKFQMQSKFQIRFLFRFLGSHCFYFDIGILKKQ